MTKYARSPVAARTGAATAGKAAVATIRQAARTRTRALRTIHSTRRKAQNPSRTFDLPSDSPYEGPGDTPRSAGRSVDLAGCAPVADLLYFTGTMDCGKSTLALQMDHTHKARGRVGRIFTSHDRAGESVL